MNSVFEQKRNLILNPRFLESTQRCISSVSTIICKIFPPVRSVSHKCYIQKVSHLKEETEHRTSNSCSRIEMVKIGTLPFKTCNVTVKNIPKRTLTYVFKGKFKREIQLLPLSL